jgi:UDP-N-acetylglucosamine 4,6-dehydratase
LRDFSPKSLSLDGTTLLITGGTGSFGQKFVHRILTQYSPKRVIVYSRDELKQYEMAQIFPQSRYPAIRYFIGDIRDYHRLVLAMREVDYVIHAAAMKHVPIAEYNPMECINTNVYGAENVVRASLDSGVRKVVALSTDKAANPINLYGASKLASDKIFVAANNLSGSIDTKFTVVRYGNVVGSRGSVVPLFRKLIAEGVESLPITDERMTRFWITLQQGVDFVLSALQDMQGGEIMVPRIPSMKMVDLARAMAPQVPIRVVGIRPGEKLHEVMVTEDDSRNTLMTDDRYLIEPSFGFWNRAPYLAKGAVPVAEEFRYASNTNDQWLSAEELMDFLR